MNKALIRAVAMLLVPALLWDPALASALRNPNFVANIDRLPDPTIAARFGETALTLPIVQSPSNLLLEGKYLTARIRRDESPSLLSWRQVISAPLRIPR